MNNGYYPLTEGYQETTCRTCGARITFVTTASGAPMPLDLATARPAAGGRWQEAQSHFATCPNAAAWSGNRAATAPQMAGQGRKGSKGHTEPARAASAELGAAEQLVLDGMWAPRKNGQGGLK